MSVTVAPHGLWESPISGDSFTARSRHVVNQERANLRRQFVQLLAFQATQLPRCAAARQQVA